MSFFSIPGMNRAGSREPVARPWTAEDHPGASEFLASRKDTSHDASGFTPGDEIYHRGEPGVVLREQKNSRGEIETVYRVGRHGDAAVYKAVWAPDQARSIVIRDVRRTDDYE